MSRIYDNWGRLVAATLDREKLHQLALASSMETSSNSSVSPRFNFPFNFKFKSTVNHEPGWSYFLTAILLADHLVRISENAASFRQECLEIKAKAKRVALLLRCEVLANQELYHRPARYIMDATETILKKAISIVQKCQGLKRVFTAISPSSFQDILSQLEYSIGNICWLLCDGQYRGVPPIAADEPVLYSIWELIAILHTSTVEHRCQAVASLVSLARESHTYRKLIIEEGGAIQPLLRLVQEGTPEAQENALTVIVLLGKENRQVIDDTVSSVFVRILKESPLIKLQGTVAWAVSVLAGTFYDYERYNFVHLLSHLAFRTLPDDSKVYLARAAGGIYSPMRGNNLRNGSGTLLSRGSNRATETDGLATNDYIKVMATRGLWRLAIANMWNCRIITESKALMCFAFFLEKGPKEARYNSAMALTEITAVVEHNTELRRLAFKLNLPAYKAVVNQLFRVIDQEELEILVPCVKVIGNLARTFKATETRMLSCVVKLLDARETKVLREACIALAKFACSDNYLCKDHSKAIINAGGVNFLVRLLGFGELTVQRSALTLLCYVASNVPESEKFAEAGVLARLRCASKHASLIQFEDVDNLLPRVIGLLELKQSRGHH